MCPSRSLSANSMLEASGSETWFLVLPSMHWSGHLTLLREGQKKEVDDRYDDTPLRRFLFCETSFISPYYAVDIVYPSLYFNPPGYITADLGHCEWTIFDAIDWTNLVFCQWQTTWNRTKLFKSLDFRPPLQFVTPGAIGSGHIVVSDNVTYQEIVGFGGSLSKLTCLNFQGPKLIV